MSGPARYPALVEAIGRRHDRISRHFQQIARYLLKNPNEVALAPVRVLASRAGVQPSTLVRFAQAFGYEGFKEMQLVFKANLLDGSKGFNSRIQTLRRGLGSGAESTNLGFAQTIVAADIAALEALLEGLREDRLEAAADLLARAPTVWLTGQIEGFPVAWYIAYALTHLGRDARLMDLAGRLAFVQAKNIRPDDLLVAVDFQGGETSDVWAVAEIARQRKVPILAIINDGLGPLARAAAVAFDVREERTGFLASIGAPIALAQALVVCLAHKLDPDRVESGRFLDFDPMSW